MSLKNKINLKKAKHSFNQSKAFHLSSQIVAGRGKHGRPSFVGKSKESETAQGQ